MTSSGSRHRRLHAWALATALLAAGGFAQPVADAGVAAPPELRERVEASPGASEAAPPEDLSLGWVLFRTVVVLGLVVATIYVTLHFGLRRLLGIPALSARGDALVSVLERVPLDQKRAVFLVKAAGEYLLIGGGEGNLALLTRLDAAEVERIRRERPAPTAHVSPFLQKLLARRGSPPPSDSP